MGRYHPPARGTTSDVVRAEGKSGGLLERMRGRIRRLGLARRTEDAYVGWVVRFIRANGRRHPRELGGREVEAFLTTLAVRGNVAPSTQNQALAALLFLYREVLEQDLPWMEDIRRAKKPQRLPVVLSREECAAVLAEMSGVHRLMASLLYGSALRLMECVRLRVKDVDFARGELTVCEPARVGGIAARCCRRHCSQHCRRSWRRCVGSIAMISRPDTAQPGCLPRWA
ncbi:hypothetical protein E4582_01955 [Luteimonas yindakuii]|uniref:Integron integrase n=1 Tax=Luteimonas yindakuii TaxID=2565782 RepID=A0A4Z1RG52_9GAMM|nr:hypothetical protein E4582_01955 [Luteimonas yindakuii]